MMIWMYIKTLSYHFKHVELSERVNKFIGIFLQDDMLAVHYCAYLIDRLRQRIPTSPKAKTLDSLDAIVATLLVVLTDSGKPFWPLSDGLVY